jgi:hypothetical protein
MKSWRLVHKKRPGRLNHSSPDTSRDMFHVERRHKQWRKWLNREGLRPGTTKNEANRPADLGLPVVHSTGSEFNKLSGRDGFEIEACAR